MLGPRLRRRAFNQSIGLSLALALSSVAACSGSDPIESAASSTEAAPTSTVTDFQVQFSTLKDAVVRIDADYCTESGVGSGFFIDGRHVLTAAHVVDGARSFSVVTAQGPTSGQVIGIDRARDIALIQTTVDTSRPFIPLGSQPMVGQLVAAIGYPDGELTLTTGTVSGQDRELPTDAGINRGVIQTDAAVNPGGSGGPLIDLQGQAVGIVIAKNVFSDATGYAVNPEAAQHDAANLDSQTQPLAYSETASSRSQQKPRPRNCPMGPH